MKEDKMNKTAKHPAYANAPAGRPNTQRPKHKHSRGQALVVLILIFTAVVTLTGLVTDVGTMMVVRHRMQRAADAAALAAGLSLPSVSACQAQAENYAAQNGFVNGAGGVTVVSEIDPDGDHNNWVRVTITAPFNFIFGRIIGLSQRTLTIFATAQYSTYIPISINMAGVYGEEHPDVTLMIRGKQSPYEHGDPYSIALLDDGSPNPYYDPEAYHYKVYVPDNYAVVNGTSMMDVEIFDANSGANHDSSGEKTITVYRLFAPDTTPNDYTDDVLIASFTIGPGDPLGPYEEKWKAPDGFSVDTAVWGTGTYRVNVQSLDGYNANGFHLRAGPDDDSTFNPDNGTKITTDGRLPVRFNKAGNIVMELGFVPAAAAGTNLHINKFDTDIGSTSIIYSCDTLTQTWDGVLAGNAEWKEDVIEVPSAYAGGTWYATYYAGNTDCSVWSMWYEGMESDEDGFVSLVE